MRAFDPSQEYQMTGFASEAAAIAHATNALPAGTAVLVVQDCSGEFAWQYMPSFFRPPIGAEMKIVKLGTKHICGFPHKPYVGPFAMYCAHCGTPLPRAVESIFGSDDVPPPELLSGHQPRLA